MWPDDSMTPRNKQSLSADSLEILFQHKHQMECQKIHFQA